MNTLDKWAERVYTETDFGRSIATSVAGIIGLTIYLAFADWVIAAFSSIISFPVVRLIATEFHKKATDRAKRRVEQEEVKRIYARLSDDEKQVVDAFVLAGGAVLTWGRINNMNLPAAGVESLIQRGVLWPSTTADGLTETLALDIALFDVGQVKWEPPF